MYTAAKRIASLREQGWLVRVRMERIVGKIDHIPSWDSIPSTSFAARHEIGSGQFFNPKGGVVTVSLSPPGEDHNEWIVGKSRCHPRYDNFDRKIGLEAALGRAEKQAVERGYLPG